MRVVIIGAGLGGLTLAHGLRAADVDVTVYERSPRTGPQPAGYGIHINAHGNRSLHACLPAENWAMFDDAGVPAPDVVRFRDPTLNVLTTLEVSTPADVADPVVHRRAVRREDLHRALLHGLDDVVEWGTTFESYTREPDGRVRVAFADGTHTVGDLLVGADGSNSRVRRQYLPELVRHELGILNVAGRLPLSHPAARALPHDMVDGSVNNVVPAEPGWLFASTWPASDHDTDRGVAHEDHLVWAYVAERDSYPADVESLTPEQLQRWVAQRIAGWDPRVAAVVTSSAADTVAPVPLRSMSTLPAWAPSTVTLLGDAIHNMTPMAGIGANTALRDADTLRLALTAHGSQNLVERVGCYEEQMRSYANEALALSMRNARNAASSRRLPRLAFRTLLRLTDAVPPIKRAVFPATAHAAARSIGGPEGLPGDDLVPDAQVTMDRVVDLPAPPEAVWPWLAQLGKNRAGWYSPRWIERFLPPRGRGLRHIEPRLQHLAPGDVIDDWGGRNATFTIMTHQPPTTLVHWSQRGNLRISWTILVQPRHGTSSRMHLRFRIAGVRRLWLVTTFGEALDALTVAALAAGLRERIRDVREPTP